MSEPCEPTPESVLGALLSPPTVPYITSSKEPSLENPDPKNYTTSATFDFPDGGRFLLRLSGPPFTAFIDGQHGLPDGFLMEINNYIFSTLFCDRIPTPQNAVASLLENASQLYQRAAKSASRKRLLTNDTSGTQSSPIATAALAKQLSMIEKMDTRTDGFVVRPSEDNLYIWSLQLFFEGKIQNDLIEAGHSALQLELRFPSNFPYSPPFVRIVAPYISCRYVMPRGGICMQLFSTSGWTPANSIDAVCVQIRAMLIAGGIQISEAKQFRYTYEGALRDSQNAFKQHRWNEAAPLNLKKKKKRLDTA